MTAIGVVHPRASRTEQPAKPAGMHARLPLASAAPDTSRSSPSPIWTQYVALASTTYHSENSLSRG